MVRKKWVRFNGWCDVWRFYKFWLVLKGSAGALEVGVGGGGGGKVKLDDKLFSDVPRASCDEPRTEETYQKNIR